MTRNEFSSVFKRLRVLLSGITLDEGMIEEYYNCVCNYPIDIFNDAVTHIIKTEEKFPTPARILKVMQNIDMRRRQEFQCQDITSKKIFEEDIVEKIERYSIEGNYIIFKIINLKTGVVEVRKVPKRIGEILLSIQDKIKEKNENSTF